jgi:hypothetical protein
MFLLLSGGAGKSVVALRLLQSRALARFSGEQAYLVAW